MQDPKIQSPEVPGALDTGSNETGETVVSESILLQKEAVEKGSANETTGSVVVMPSLLEQARNKVVQEGLKTAVKTTQEIVDMLRAHIGKHVEVKTHEICNEGIDYGHPIERDITYKGTLKDVDPLLKNITMENYTLEDSVYEGLVMDPKKKPASIEGYLDHTQKGQIAFEAGYQRIRSISSEDKEIYQEKDMPRSEKEDEWDARSAAAMAELEKEFEHWKETAAEK